jgi:hypothetical protein
VPLCRIVVQLATCAATENSTMFLVPHGVAVGTHSVYRIHTQEATGAIPVVMRTFLVFFSSSKAHPIASAPSSICAAPVSTDLHMYYKRLCFTPSASTCTTLCT